MGAAPRQTRLIEGISEVVAVLWLVSWLALYLEIFRWHHVKLFQLASVMWPGNNSPNQPGGFVRSVVFCSISAPVAWLALVALRQMQLGPSSRRAALKGLWPRPLVLAVLGGIVASLGAVNQAIQGGPLQLDLTLRHGNGGFIFMGVMLGVVGGLICLSRHRRSRAL